MNSSEDLREALARPRRFLILMSLAVIAFYALRVGVKPEAEYSGFVLTLARPDLAIYGLWVIWAWALWRYGQKVYELLTAIWNDMLQDVQAEDTRIAMAKARKEANRLAAQGLFEKAPKAARARGRVRVRQPRGDDFDKNAEGESVTSFPGFWPRQGGGRKYPIEVTFDWSDNGGGAVNEIFDMTLTPDQTRWVRVRAWVHSAIRLPALTDHIAPIIVAMFALVSPFIFVPKDVVTPAACYSMAMRMICL